MWCKNLPELIDFIRFTVVCAPDAFPKEDFLRPEEQLDLAGAFEVMKNCLDRSVEEFGPSLVADFQRTLNEARSFFEAGSENEGAWKLQELLNSLISEMRKKSPAS